MAFVALTAEEVNAKSPVDDALMEKIKENFNDLDSRIVVSGSNPLVFPVPGRLSLLTAYPHLRSFGTAIVNQAFTPSSARWVLKQSGTSGTITFDIRKHTTPETPITEIAHAYSGTTSAIARRSAAVSTQSVARVTPQISTQSITHAKSAINISSIINVGTNIWQYNLASALDSDNLVGDSMVVASATSGGNNGTFTVVEIGRGGGNNFTVTNASGVVQLGAAGTVQPKIMSYNYTNPVDSNFAAADIVVMATHTTGANNGNLTIFKINQSGNNIWVKNSTGVVQAGVAGTADTSRMVFTFASAVSADDYVVGEYATGASHSSGNNNGTFIIRAVNSGGNNLVLQTASGAVQGGAAGNVSTNRWKYTLSADPTGSLIVGDQVYGESHSTAANNGTFTVVEINASAGTNIVVHNSAGVAQGGAAGTIYSLNKLVKFASDQSAVYSTASYIEMYGCGTSAYNLVDTLAPFRVYEVNRGGGANYNVVIRFASSASQASPAGYVQTESRSIFTVAPSISADVTGILGNQNVVGSSTSIDATLIAANTPLMLYVTNSMGGDPFDLTVELV